MIIHKFVLEPIPNKYQYKRCDYSIHNVLDYQIIGGEHWVWVALDNSKSIKNDIAFVLRYTGISFEATPLTRQEDKYIATQIDAAGMVWHCYQLQF